MSASYRPRDYLLAMEGLAILRAWGTDPAEVSTRVEEIEAFVQGPDASSYAAMTRIMLKRLARARLFSGRF